MSFAAHAPGSLLRTREGEAATPTRPSHPGLRTAAPRFEVPGAPHLGPRERQVLALVARGYRDRTIAAELLTSRRTVTTHVTSILNTLGVDTRSAATAYAIHHQLLAERT
jgi:DNA-binding NarL/FixJ family response regulator